MALHFGVVPTDLDEDQINDYLYLMPQQHKTPSESYFKFTVYGLRYVFRLSGLKDKHIALPAIKKNKRFPIVLSREEVKRLMKAPRLIKHRVLIGLLYGCGLRCFDVRNLRLSDMDFDRKTLLVRKGKGGKKLDKQLNHREFIQRFAMHILPRGFMRIRHYGILSSTSKLQSLAMIREQLPPEVILRNEPRTIAEPVTPGVCPHGKTETMITLEILPSRGPPSWPQSLSEIGNEYKN